jgi:ribonuclease HII
MFGMGCGMESLLSDIASSPRDNFRFERSLHQRGFACIAGSDEVGRGPLAGPVVAASVVLPCDCDHGIFLDSKKISHSRRLLRKTLLHDINAGIGIGIVSVETIDRINILQASLLAMKRAVNDMAKKLMQPDFILVDGTFEIPLTIPQITLTKGESKSASIAAASIVAKVKRDTMMDTLDRKYPGYNFKKNKGYPTREHRLAISKYGPCPIHRKTFIGVKEFV